MVSARASLSFASDHCSMRFVSAAVAGSFVADVPARVVCFFLGIGASGYESPGKGVLAGARRAMRAAAVRIKAPNTADVR